MSKRTMLAAACLLAAGQATAQSYAPVAAWLPLSAGRATLGNMHGDRFLRKLPAAVTIAGDLFVAEFSSFRRVHKFEAR